MRPLAAERSITITRQGAESSLTVRADRRRLSQILVNLISNAVKYNRRGGSITITSRVGSDGRAVIEVADTGAGLTEDELDRVFMPFERLGAEQTDIEGTGIGLPLARTLTEAMDGQLAATSTPGQGSVFIISLPRAPDMAPIPASTITSVTAAPPEDPGTGIIDVLYIEDNPANVEVVARYLKTWPGVRIRSASSGQAGIESALRKAPSIVLLDLHLSDMSGENVLTELKAEPATAAVPIAILSADATPGTIRRLETKGAVAYLTKPLDLTELGNLLDSVTAAAHPPIDRLAVHADRATGGALAAGERGGQRMRDI